MSFCYHSFTSCIYCRRTFQNHTCSEKYKIKDKIRHTTAQVLVSLRYFSRWSSWIVSRKNLFCMVVLCCQSTGMYNKGAVKQMSRLISFGFHHVNSCHLARDLAEGAAAALSSNLHNRPPLHSLSTPRIPLCIPIAHLKDYHT